jgi:hypothetical protein
MGDMERKITLMVFVLSSVLILAGFSTTEEAYAQVSDFYWSETTIWTAPGTGGQVYTADAATNTVTQLTAGGFARIDDVEIDRTNNKLYWNNWASGSGASGPAEGIYRSNLDGTVQTQVTGVAQSSSSATGAAGLHGISLDPSTQTIYFTRGVSYADGNGGPEVSKVNYDGTGYTKLNGINDGWFLDGITHSSSNVVYWGSPGVSNTATGGAINSVNSDGTGITYNLVPHTNGLGRSLAIDENKGLIFFSKQDTSGPAGGSGPSALGQIWVYDINTSIANLLLDDPTTGIPDVELDTNNMIIYWTDFARGEIRSASYDAAGNLGPIGTVISGLTNPYGLALEFDDQAVGGTDIPINTSALLLAGATSVSMWMIPVVVAGAGIGAFVVIRRR